MLVNLQLLITCLVLRKVKFYKKRCPSTLDTRSEWGGKHSPYAQIHALSLFFIFLKLCPCIANTFQHSALEQSMQAVNIKRPQGSFKTGLVYLLEVLNVC